MKPVAELIAVPGKSFPALVFADGFRDLPAGTKLYAEPTDVVSKAEYQALLWLQSRVEEALRNGMIDMAVENALYESQAAQNPPMEK
jgi:hypothetical protein